MKNVAKLKGQLIVVKLGGSSLPAHSQDTNEAKSAVAYELSKLVAGYRQRGAKIVVVHGGGPAINYELIACGISWTFVNGQRQTTPEMMTVIERVLASNVNSAVVGNLKRDGIPATGLSGASDEILFCEQKSLELGLVGDVKKVSAWAIEDVLQRGEVPVIAPLGFGIDEQRFNVNADWAAMKIAETLGADQLIFLTDQNGILDHRRKQIGRATPRDLEEMIASGIISGGMCTKVRAMIEALNADVGQVRVLNANAASAVLSLQRVGTTLMTSVPKRAPRPRQVISGFAS